MCNISCSLDSELFCFIESSAYYQWLNDYVNVSIMFFEIFQCFETSICNFIDRNVTIVDVQMSEFK